MRKTLSERYAEALVASGEKEVESKSRKYRTFTRRNGGFYFIGKSGALRFGHSSSTSIPVSDGRKALLLGGEKSTTLDAAHEISHVVSK